MLRIMVGGALAPSIILLFASAFVPGFGQGGSSGIALLPRAPSSVRASGAHGGGSGTTESRKEPVEVSLVGRRLEIELQGIGPALFQRVGGPGAIGSPIKPPTFTIPRKPGYQSCGWTKQCFESKSGRIRFCIRYDPCQWYVYALGGKVYVVCIVQ